MTMLDDVLTDLRQTVAVLEQKLDERAAERDEALAREAATAEVLQVINTSPGDLGPMFDAILEKAMRLCEASLAHLFTFDGEYVRPVAMRGDPYFAQWLRQLGPHSLVWGSLVDRLRQGEPFVHMLDSRERKAYRASPLYRELIDVSGCRSAISVALRKDDTLLGTAHLYRQEMRAFSNKEIALLENFAAQAVIAMENARLLDELRQRTGGFMLIYGDVTERKRAEAEIRAARDAAERALAELKTAQASLLHAQKMAALGQLTAGIAHEIKNPLNFVNNFADLSVELLDELEETAAPAPLRSAMIGVPRSTRSSGC